MSKVVEERKRRYAQIMENIASPANELILSRDGAQVGVWYSEARDYVGEAGRSSRIRVLWPDGKLTTCCVKGLQKVECRRIM